MTWSDGTVGDTLFFAPGSSTIVSASMVGTSNSVTKDIVILVYQNPTVNAGADQSIPRGTYVNVEGSGADVYQWDLINNTSNIDYLDCNTCPSTGGYILFTSLYTLTGWNEYGCPDVDTLLITIDGEISVYVPNVFSPNGDGENDVFRVYGPDFYMYRLAIFNRWGEMIFELDNNTEG